MGKFSIFSATTGLNVKTDPARIPYDPETGVQALAVGYNVDIDDTGRVSRRKGFTEISAGSYHSLFCDGGTCLVVTGNALCTVNPDLTTTAIRNVTEGVRISYAQVNNETYYCNGYEKGIVRDGASYSWVKGSYIGPDTTREFVDPPTGSLVEYYNGRMYVIQGKVAWYSEPYAFGAFDRVRGFIHFSDNIRMFRAVSDGIWVSTEKQTFFLSGTKPAEFERIHIADYPALKWSDTRFNGRLVLLPDGTPTVETAGGDLAVMWMSEKGVCFGGPGGFYNLTEHKLTLPSGITGSGLVYDGKYIGLINP